MRNLLVFGILLPVVGVIMVVLGIREQSLAATASKAPEEISLKALIARGPDGNPNIILKDFVLCDNFVFKTQRGRWSGAWIPAVPSDAVAPGQVGGGKPPVIQALIFTINSQDQQDLVQRCGQPRLRALVTNKLVSLGGEERRLLEQSYPGTDFTKCLIVQEGREPAGWVLFIIMIGGGSLATFIGLGLLGFAGIAWLRQPAAKTKRRRTEEEDDDDEDERPKRRRRPRAEGEDEEDDRPRRGSRQRDDEEDDDRPRKKKRRRTDDDS